MLAEYYTNFKMQAYEHNYYASGGKKTWEEGVEGVEEVTSEIDNIGVN